MFTCNVKKSKIQFRNRNSRPLLSAAPLAPHRPPPPTGWLDSYSYTLLAVSDLDDFLRVPHGVLEPPVVALLALLAVELEQHVARVARIVQMEPENHPTLHRRPSMTAALQNSTRVRLRKRRKMRGRRLMKAGWFRWNQKLTRSFINVHP